MVGQRAAEGVPVRVLSSLQDELLALEVMVLKTNPASERQTDGGGLAQRSTDDALIIYSKYLDSIEPTFVSGPRPVVCLIFIYIV